MDDTTKKALEQRITKWIGHAKAAHPSEVQIGPKECPLCLLFAFNENQCDGCPVKASTELPWCDHTPYKGAYDAKWAWWHRLQTTTAKSLLDEAETNFKQAAQKEVDFLISLREEV